MESGGEGPGKPFFIKRIIGFLERRPQPAQPEQGISPQSQRIIDDSTASVDRITSVAIQTSDNAQTRIKQAEKQQFQSSLNDRDVKFQIEERKKRLGLK